MRYLDSHNQLDQHHLVSRVMTAAFYENVDRFFQLIDLDGDNRIDRDEAHLAFTVSYDDVYQTHSGDESGQGGNDSDVDPLSKSQQIRSQVDWLFSAAHVTDIPTAAVSTTSTPVSPAEFRHTYERLLTNGYEAEVLDIDLQRAIHALQMPTWRAVQSLIRRALALVDDSQPQRSPAIVRSVVEHILANTHVSPRVTRDAKRLTDTALRLPTISRAQWIGLIKSLLVANVEIDVISAALDRVDGGSNTATPQINGIANHNGRDDDSDADADTRMQSNGV